MNPSKPMADGFTFFIYLSVLVTTVFLAYLTFNRYANLPKRLSSILVTIIFLILTLVGGLRYEVGQDYHSYERLFIERPWVENEYDRAERDIGFMFLIDRLSESNVPNWSIFLAFSFFTILFLFLSFNKSPGLLSVGIFFFLTLGFYFYSFNAVRQAFAMSALMLALTFVEKRKFIPFLICILLGASIHKSLIIFIPAYFILYRRIFIGKAWLLVAIGAIGFGFMLSFFFSSFIDTMNFLTESVEFGYRSAINKSGSGSLMSILSPIFIAKVILGLTIVHHAESLYKEFPKSVPFVNMSVIGALVYSAFSQVQFISRFNYYFQFMNVMTFSFLTMLWIYNRKERNVVVLLGYCSAFYLLSIIQGDSGSTPYQFIEF